MPKSPFLGTISPLKLAFFLENRCISPLLAPLMFNDLTKNTFKYDFLMNSYFNHIVLTSKNSFRRELKKGLKLCFNCFRAHSERVVTRGLNQITERIYGIPPTPPSPAAPLEKIPRYVTSPSHHPCGLYHGGACAISLYLLCNSLLTHSSFNVYFK